MFFLKSFSATVLLAMTVITFSICVKAAGAACSQQQPEIVQKHFFIVNNWCRKLATPASDTSNIVVTQVDSKNGNKQLVPDPPGETTGKLGSAASYLISGSFEGYISLSMKSCKSPASDSSCPGYPIIVLALQDKASEVSISVTGNGTTSPIAVPVDFQLFRPQAHAPNRADRDPLCFSKHTCNGEGCNMTPAICRNYQNVSLVINFCDVPATSSLI